MPEPLPFIQSDLRRKRITITSKPDVRIRAAIVEFPSIEGESDSGGLSLEVPDFKAWSPESPTVYTLRYELGDGQTGEARFAFREFTTKDKHLQLNNRAIFLRGMIVDAAVASHCGTSDSARAWLQGLKQAGINFLRMRGVAAPAGLLDAADTLGVLVCDQPQIAHLLPAPDLVTQCEQIIRARVLEHCNRPSVVMWDVAPPPGAAAHAVALVNVAHATDPTRIAATGLDNHAEPAFMLRPHHDESMHLDVVAAHLPAPSSHRSERFYESIGSTAIASIAAEFGVLAIDLARAAHFSKNDGDNESITGRELDQLFTGAGGIAAAMSDVRAESLRLQIQSARMNPKLSGYCLNPMSVAEANALRDVQSPMLLVIRAVRTNLVPREEIPVTVTVVNDERIEPQADLSLQVVGPTNQVLWKKKRAIKIPKQTREIWSGTISASGSIGVHRFVVRLMQGMKMLSQNSIDINVIDPAATSEVETHVVDPHQEWTERCMKLARSPRTKARVIVVPSLGNTIRAYPETEVTNMLAEVRAGAVAIVFGPPSDWNELADRVDQGIRATSIDSADAYHYVKLHPVFDGLPARCIMRQAYRNVVARRAFTDVSDEEISGALAIHEGSPWAGDTILVRRFGSGRIVFTHLRVLEYLGVDPVADRMFVNLLRHFSRRSVPSEEIAPVPQAALDWLRRERLDRARLWHIIGPFANWENEGHAAAYPPEHNVDLAAVHAGWRDPVRWLRWYALGEVRNELDFDESLRLPFVGDVSVIPETFYAYAECFAPARQAGILRLRTSGSVKLYANGALVFERKSEDELATPEEVPAQVTFKQGKNTLLLKFSRVSAPARIALEFASGTRDPLILKWWR